MIYKLIMKWNEMSCIYWWQITADRESGTAAGRILMNPLDTNCGIQRLFIQDRNRTADILLPCGGATRGTFQTQRERTLYVSDSDTISVYLQASTHRLAHSHHMYLIKFQGKRVYLDCIQYRITNTYDWLHVIYYHQYQVYSSFFLIISSSFWPTSTKLVDTEILS